MMMCVVACRKDSAVKHENTQMESFSELDARLNAHIGNQGWNLKCNEAVCPFV